jgi:ribosomal protein S3AE
MFFVIVGLVVVGWILHKLHEDKMRMIRITAERLKAYNGSVKMREEYLEEVKAIALARQKIEQEEFQAIVDDRDYEQRRHQLYS